MSSIASGSRSRSLSSRLGVLALLICAFIWGLAFSAQKKGMASLGPFSFNGLRSFIGVVALLPCLALLDVLQGVRPSFWGSARTPEARLRLLGGGVLCGLALGSASLAQQVGIQYTSVGKAGFLTALYIILVPILGQLLGRRTPALVWGAAFMALVGSALLCGLAPGNLSLQRGDFLLLACAFLFAVQILCVDKFVATVDCVRLSAFQFFFAGVVSLVLAPFAGETISLGQMVKGLGPLLFCGVLSSGVAYTLQCVGQKYVHPVVATLLMSLESVISALGGWLVLGEAMGFREMAGCAIIFLAVLLAQLTPSQKS
ncbi:MAG: DMT family transporter [Oligosphaeraceae bacterium]